MSKKEASEIAESLLAKHFERQLALDLLRDKCRLRLSDVQGDLPSRVRVRQEQYWAHLAKLKQIWAEEDAKDA